MGSEEDDRLSGLSDTLIHHIFSFLPTKCVVSTSCLSKRWRYLWTFIPVFDFREWGSSASDSGRLSTNRFMDFLDRLLTFRHDEHLPTIQKFYLKCDKYFDESRLNVWISSLIWRKVEELILFIPFGESSLFPLCFFTCESLTLLELDMTLTLKLPKSISFPRLKILRLTNIEFVNEKLTHRFFSNCPVLEELSLTNCSWDVLPISAPNLKRLFINGPSSYGFGNSKLKINTPSLQSLRYFEPVAKDFVLHINSSLVDAEIDFLCLEGPPEMREEIGYSASKLLADLSNVKLLKISGNSFQLLSYPFHLLTSLPTFYNLNHLEVLSSSFSLEASSNFPYSPFPCLIIQTIFSFLQLAPNLESLVFAEGFDRYLSDNIDGWTLNLVPRSSLLHLKSFELREFGGNHIEMNVIKFVLKNARVLQRMTLIFSSCLSRELKYKKTVMDLILMLPKCSTSCVVNFS